MALLQRHGVLYRARTVLDDKYLQQLAESKGKDIGQIILRWHYQHGVVPLPRSSNDDRQKGNLNIFDFELSEEEMTQIDGLDRPDGRIDNQDPNEYEEF